MQSGAPPANQEDQGGVNDLDCKITENDGVRYVECLRDYDTGDQIGDDTDFYEFIVGINPMLYAWGPITTNGELLMHGANEYGYGEAHLSNIYMEQEYGVNLCGYAKEYADKQSVDGPSDAEQAWMIVGIVFIVLFACALGAAIYMWCLLKAKDDDDRPKGSSGYQPTANNDY